MRTCKECKSKFEPRRDINGNLPKFTANNRFCATICQKKYGAKADYWYANKIRKINNGWD